MGAPRRRPHAVLAGALLVAAISGPARAADDEGEFAIKGGGLQTCERFLAAWDEGSSDLALYGGWIEGYLTGLNQHVDDAFDLVPWQNTESLLGLVKLACDAAEPEKRFIGAVNDVVRLLFPSRLSAASPAQALVREGRSVVIYDEMMKRVAARLVELGYDAGTAEAGFDETAALALEKFQADRGLAVTGLPDQATLVALFLR